MYFVHNRVESIFSIGSLVQRLVPEVAARGRPRTDGRGRPRTGDARFRRARSSTSCWRRRSSRTASTFPTRTPSSSTAPIATACRSSISCADDVGRSDRPAYALPADSAGRQPVAGCQESGSRRSRSSAISAADSASPRSTSRSAAPATCSAANRAATSKRSASRCMKLLEQTVRELKGEELEPDDPRQRQSAHRRANRRVLCARHEPAADRSTGGLPRRGRDAEIDRVLEEAADRYGPLPESMLNLADFGRIRVMADRARHQTASTAKAAPSS